MAFLAAVAAGCAGRGRSRGWRRRRAAGMRRAAETQVMPGSRSAFVNGVRRLCRRKQ